MAMGTGLYHAELCSKLSNANISRPPFVGVNVGSRGPLFDRTKHVSRSASCYTAGRTVAQRASPTFETLWELRPGNPAHLTGCPTQGEAKETVCLRGGGQKLAILGHCCSGMLKRVLLTTLFFQTKPPTFSGRTCCLRTMRAGSLTRSGYRYI